MKQENLNYFMVGAFVLIALAVLMVALYKITGRSANVDYYYIDMQNVSGIRDGSPVTYAGFEIGQITGIEPVRENGRTRYRVEIIVSAGWQIPDDSVAQVVSPSMLGDKKLDISEGNSKTYFQPGAVISGLGSTDIFQIASDLAADFRKLSDQGLKPLFETINREITVAVPDMVKQSTQLLKRLNTSSERILKLLEVTDEKRINKIVSNAESMTDNLLGISRRLEQASVQVDKLLQTTTNMMQENNEDLRHAVLDLRTTMGVVSDNINGIVYNLDITARNLNEFSRQVRDNPGALLNSKPPQDAAK